MTRQTSVCVLCFLVLSVFARYSSANEGRIEALAHNPLVRDDTDVTDYPGLLTTYGDRVFLTVADNATTGDVGAIIGRNYAFGIWVHRTPTFSDLESIDEIFESFVLPQTHHLADLMFGLDNGFGFRLSFSAGLDTEKSEDIDGELVSDGETSLGVDIHFGYSLDRDNYHGDIAAGITLNYFDIVRSGQTLYRTGWIPSFELRHRSVLRPRRPVSGILDILFTRRAYSAVAEGEPSLDGSFGRWVLSISGGPKLSLPSGLTLWIAAQMNFENLSGEVGNEAQPSVMAIGPGVIGSAELRLLDLIAVRAGVGYDFYWGRSHYEGSEFDPERSEMQLGQRFHWSIGLGFEISGFRIDGTLAHELLFGGPQSIGGGNPGLMGTVSATYAW